MGIDRVFDVTNLPSYRLTIDMRDLDGARIVITTGQSGNPFDQHYGDLIPLWANGDTLALPFSAPNVASSAAQKQSEGDCAASTARRSATRS